MRKSSPAHGMRFYRKCFNLIELFLAGYDSSKLVKKLIYCFLRTIPQSFLRKSGSTLASKCGAGAKRLRDCKNENYFKNLFHTVWAGSDPAYFFAIFPI